MSPPDDAVPSSARAVFEAVTVEKGDFEAISMGRGEPGVPRRFRWRGRDYEVAAVLASRREVSKADASAGAYVRRHVFTVLTRTGERMELSGARTPRGGRSAASWILRTIVGSEPGPGRDSHASD